MLERISMCQRCTLFVNQPPLVDTRRTATIMVVGLSAKKIQNLNEIPLDNCTKSGHLVSCMEEISEQSGYTLYRTNLVKCVPLDENCKLRYPTKKEIDLCFENLLLEMEQLNPQIIIFFGKIVREAFEQRLMIHMKEMENNKFSICKANGRYYIATYHPSYVTRSSVRIKQYLENYSFLINRFHKGEIE